MVQYLLEEDSGGFFTRWFCPVPEEGVGFIVVKDNWIKSDGKFIREIHQIKLISVTIKDCNLRPFDRS